MRLQISLREVSVAYLVRAMCYLRHFGLSSVHDVAEEEAVAGPQFFRAIV